ncbi:MAG: histidinol dehydrogenase [Dehalococcoidia bacterium]|jgi:histidinol dehydrogenase|nr:histidinol dehydrogenase [Dehalococcoidia bacterium]
MKILRGLVEGRKALDRDAFAEEQVASPELMEGIKRIFGQPLTPEETVARIISQVSRRGDDAVREYTKLVDGVDLAAFELGRDDISRAASEVPPEVAEALGRASSRIRQFHAATLSRPWMDMENGFGEMITPIERVGIYIPGGRAAYPSTVLMTVIPARVAGVKEVFLATPPRGDQGPSPAVMAAAQVVGVSRVFQVGGAQAIAAMAYGTETIPRVDMICGPGNIFVTLAKKMVYGQVGIDGLEGPTETLIIADETANPVLCAADLLGQAEHDLLATPALITTSESLLSPIREEIKKQLDGLSRKDTASSSIESRGVFVLVDTLDEALELANDYAPEHLCLMVKDPWDAVGKVRHTGGIFLGDHSPESMGDYVAGPSHVMPTGGSARFNSYLGVNQFLKRTPVVALDPDTARRFTATAAILARAENFDAHARSVELRMELQDKSSQSDSGSSRGT